MEELKDIRLNESINIDISLYIYAAVGFVVLIMIFFIIRYFVRKKKKKPTKAQISLNYLKAMDFKSSTKDIVYDFTLYGSNCLNEKNKDAFYTLVQKLEEYKYKKEVSELSKELIADMKDYIRVRL